MKNAAKFFVIAGSALLLTMLALGNWGVNTNVKVLKIHQSPVSVWADGSVPIPPPPKGTGLSVIPATTNLLADGSVPIPPPPPRPSGLAFGSYTNASHNNLWADGSVPIPPPPTGLSQPATALA